MEITEITPGASFSTAHELPVSTVRPAAKSVGNKGGNNGALGGKKKTWRSGDEAWRKSKFLAEEKKADMAATEENKMIMVVTSGGKRRFVKLSQYRTA